MTFSFTIPVWAVDTFMVLGCIGVMVSCVKTCLEIALLRIKSKR